MTAAPLKLDYLRVGSRIYSNVVIMGANATDLYFTHNQGIANVKLRSVEESLRKRFNYDPKAAAEAEKRQMEDDTLYQNGLASNLVAQAMQAARAAQRAAATSDESLADPISEHSPLGKPAPDLQVEKWLTQKPLLKGKFVLVVFWAPWSIPCRKAIPDLNALQRRFADRVEMVGLTSDSAEEIAHMPGPGIDFASGVDAKGRLSAAMGVTSVPEVVLLDPKGIVRFEGHPAVLDEKKLQGLLSQ